MNKPTSDMYIIKIIDEYTVVINKGSADDIKSNHRFLIYSVDDEPLIDPVTNKNLGYLENIKGNAAIKHLQDNICTLESSKYRKPSKTVKKQNSYFMPSVVEETTDEREQLPFEGVKIGDFVKFI